MLLERALREFQPGLSWNAARRAIRSGKVQVDGELRRDPKHPVVAGSVVAVSVNAPRQPKHQLVHGWQLHLDDQVVVAIKPPGIPSVPDANHRYGTFAQLLAEQLPERAHRGVPLGVVQRLDTDTTGVMVFARTKDAQHHLKEQFRRRSVGRSYLAIVSGEAEKATYRSHLVEHKNGKRSSTRHRNIGKYACTHTELVEKLNGATLLRCRLETGRTHQIRIQLSEAGHPLLGDARYARRRIQTPPAPRVMLHAATLTFEHPLLHKAMAFELPLPEDMKAVLQGLR